MAIKIKTAQQIKYMREGGKIHREVMSSLKQKAKAGVATIELDELTNKLCKKFGVQPSFLGFCGFPASICTSVNDEIVHGIPGKRILRDGDMIGIDLGIYHQGLHTDACVTLAIGKISRQAEDLIKITEKSLRDALAVIKDNVKLGLVSHTIQKVVEKAGFNVVKNLTGHGIGVNLHEAPQILNFGQKDSGPLLKAGMALAIEPIVTIGEDSNHTLDDHWTIVTDDGALSAHFEHTLVVTHQGVQILT